MARVRNGTVLKQIRTLFNVGTTAGLTDGQLLEQFANGVARLPNWPSRPWSNGTARWSCALPRHRSG